MSLLQASMHIGQAASAAAVSRAVSLFFIEILRPESASFAPSGKIIYFGICGAFPSGAPTYKFGDIPHKRLKLLLTFAPMWNILYPFEVCAQALPDNIKLFGGTYG